MRSKGGEGEASKKTNIFKMLSHNRHTVIENNENSSSWCGEMCGMHLRGSVCVEDTPKRKIAVASVERCVECISEAQYVWKIPPKGKLHRLLQLLHFLRASLEGDDWLAAWFHQHAARLLRVNEEGRGGCVTAALLINNNYYSQSIKSCP